MSFLDRLFFRRAAPSQAPDAGVLHRLMQACEDNPEAALAALQEEQALLARELEETFLAHDAKTRALATRLASLGEAATSPEEIARLRAEQLELWRLIRRAQASTRATHELERELAEWADRPADGGELPFGHPDHPATRMELVSSELAVRGRPSRARSHAGSQAEMDCAPFNLASLENPSVPNAQDSGPAWDATSEATVQQAIAHREREIARLRALAGDNPDAEREVTLLAEEITALQAHL